MEPQDREEAYLANAAGDEVTLPACPWNRKEAYLADIGDRIDDLEEEIETIKDNPDVADIVDTYADLESYDTSTLTDKDVIRVLNDETHDGNSTYYRYNKTTDSFTYIGGSKTYDVFVGTDGTEAGEKGLVPAPATADAGKFLKADGTWDDAGTPINVVQTTGQSTTDVMSQKATTDAITIDSISVNGTAVTPDANKNVALTIPAESVKKLTVADVNGPDTNPTYIVAWKLSSGAYVAPTDGTVCYGSLNEQNYDKLQIFPGTIFQVKAISATSVNVTYESGKPNSAGSNILVEAKGMSSTAGSSSSNYGKWTNFCVMDLLTDSLTSSSSTRALTANMGKVLNDTKADKTAFTGTDGTYAGVMGLVPAPATTDAGKFLKADGTWGEAGGGGGLQSDYDEYDSTAQDYIKNRKFYDVTPYFAYGEAAGNYEFFRNTETGVLDFPFNQLPTIDGVAFDPSNGEYMNKIAGALYWYSDLTDAGAAAAVWPAYWKSALVAATHSQYALKATYWLYGGETQTMNLRKYSAVADDGESVYLFVGANVHLLVYKDMMIQLIPGGSYFNDSWNSFVPSLVAQARVSQVVAKMPSRFLPLATSTTPGVITLAQTISSVGEGLEKDSSGVVSVVAGLADYDENDSARAAYIQNRPFYEYTATEQQSLISGTVPSYFSSNQNSRSDSGWALLSNDCAQDLENRSISIDTGAFYSYVTPETMASIVATVSGGTSVTFGNIGGTWYDMDSGSEHTLNMTFTATAITQLYNGVYALTGTAIANGTTFSPAVLYLGATSDICTSGNDWMASEFGTPMTNGMILCGNNFNWVANEGGMLPQFSPSTVWTIGAEVTVTHTQKLDPKYLNTTGLILNGGTSAPTISTVGVVGTLYSCVNSGTPEVYMCTAVSGSTYTWTKILPAV